MIPCKLFQLVLMVHTSLGGLNLSDSCAITFDSRKSKSQPPIDLSINQLVELNWIEPFDSSKRNRHKKKHNVRTYDSKRPIYNPV